MTRFPATTVNGARLPSSRSLPSPTATTIPSFGFSLAASGSRMPPAVFSSASTRRMSTFSPSGFTRVLVAVFAITDLLSKSFRHSILSVPSGTRDHESFAWNRGSISASAVERGDRSGRWKRWVSSKQRLERAAQRVEPERLGHESDEARGVARRRRRAARAGGGELLAHPRLDRDVGRDEQGRRDRRGTGVVQQLPQHLRTGEAPHVAVEHRHVAETTAQEVDRREARGR